MTGNSIANRISVPDTFRMLKVNQESVTAIQVDQEKLVLRDSFLKMGKDEELSQPKAPPQKLCGKSARSLQELFPKDGELFSEYKLENMEAQILLA